MRAASGCRWTGVNELLGSLTGRHISCVRAPQGHVSAQAVQRLAARGLTTVLWSDDPRDWARPGMSVIVLQPWLRRPGRHRGAPQCRGRPQRDGAGPARHHRGSTGPGLSPGADLPVGPGQGQRGERSGISPDAERGGQREFVRSIIARNAPASSAALVAPTPSRMPRPANRSTLWLVTAPP